MGRKILKIRPLDNFRPIHGKWGGKYTKSEIHKNENNNKIHVSQEPFLLSATMSATMPDTLSATMCNNMSAKNKKIVIIICQPSCQPQCRPSCRPPCPPPCRPPCASLCQPPCRSLRCRRISILSASLNPHIVERRDIIAVADMVADTAADKKKLFLVDMLLHMVADKVPGIVANMAADNFFVLFFVLGWHVVADGNRQGGGHGGWHGSRQKKYFFSSWLTCCCTWWPTRWPAWWPMGAKKEK